MTDKLTAKTVFTGTCPECGRPATYTPLVPKGRSRAYAPTLPFMNVRCRDCDSPVRLTATPCTVCHVQALLKDSEFFAGRGLNMPTTVVLTPAGKAYRVHKSCAHDAESAIRHAGTLAIDEHGVGRWTTNGSVIPADSAAMLIALGLAQGLDLGATERARETDTREVLARYRAYREEFGYSDEERAEMRAAFDGPVVDVITGKAIEL